MRMVQASLRRLTGGAATESEAHVLDELLWAHAASCHRLEHLRARAASDGVEVVFFVRADTEELALARSRALLARAHGPLRALGYGLAPPGAER